MKLWPIIALVGALIIILVGALFINHAMQTSPSKLKVSLYYEALCPYSVKFVTKQLYPNYEKLGSYLLLDLVPYGNAYRSKVNGTWHFKCQHGPAECALNKFQACGLSKSTDQDKDIAFVNCVESYVNSQVHEQTLSDECAPILGINGSLLLECSEGAEGNEILARLGAKTDAVTPQIRGVPTIVFNDQHDESLNDDAKINFLHTVCKLLQYEPKGCPASNKIPSNE